MWRYFSFNSARKRRLRWRTATVTDHQNGTFSVEYSSTIGGPLLLSIKKMPLEGCVGFGMCEEEDVGGSPVERFVTTDAVETNPLLGPMRGGTTIRVKHAVWQLYSDAEIANANANEEFKCRFKLPSNATVVTSATWVDMNEVECVTPSTNTSGERTLPFGRCTAKTAG